MNCTGSGLQRYQSLTKFYWLKVTCNIVNTFPVMINKLILLTFLGAILGRGFSKLQNLRELHFEKGKQDCDVIRADMFESLISVKPLKHIDLSDLLMKKLGSRDAPVFKNLPYVETIILNGNPALGDVMWFTGNFWAEYVPSLKHLHLANIGIYKLIIDLLVHKLSGTKLKTLILDGNRITGINPGIHKGLSTVEVLSITENQMSSPVDLIAELLALPNLRYLNLSRQNLIMPKRSNRIRREEPPIWGMMCSRKEKYYVVYVKSTCWFVTFFTLLSDVAKRQFQNMQNKFHPDIKCVSEANS